MNARPENCSYPDAVRGRRIAAVVLLVVAGAALAGPHLPGYGRDSLLLLMGIAFIVWSALVRSPGLLVPGGVLTGIGTGTLLRGEFGQGAFLLAMAGGFLLIAGLSRAMFPGHKGCRWPLWPAAGLAVAGLLQSAGPDVRAWLRVAGPLWPYALIAVALCLFFSKPSAKA